MYDIPLFDLNYGAEEEQAVLETIRSKWISSGPKCEELERTFENMLGVKHALTLSNCTAALHLACFSAGISAGDEVICPSLTFVATVNAIRYMNAVPVFCDIKSLNNLTIDPEKAKKLITDKTKAIIVMDYAGYPCDMDAVMAMAKEYGLKVIEDACHGPLSEYKGKCLGSIGDIGCFSFYPTKNLGAMGDGGLLTTNSENIKNRVLALRNHGGAVRYHHDEVGVNSRLDEVQAAILRIKYKHINEWNKLRRQHAYKYNELFAKCSDIITPQEIDNSYCVYHQYTVKIPNRDECMKQA